MPAWFLDLLGLLYHSSEGKKYISMCNIIAHPRNWLIVMCKNIIWVLGNTIYGISN